jgi:hypothetical protein
MYLVDRWSESSSHVKDRPAPALRLLFIFLFFDFGTEDCKEVVEEEESKDAVDAAGRIWFKLENW